MLQAHPSNYTVRRPVMEDITKIEDISSTYENNPLPVNFMTAAVVEKDKEVIAFGVNRSIVEAILYCKGNPKDKTVAFKTLLEQSKKDAKEAGAKRIFAFVDEDFAKILTSRKFNFKPAKGICLVLELE